MSHVRAIVSLHCRSITDENIFQTLACSQGAFLCFVQVLWLPPIFYSFFNCCFNDSSPDYLWPASFSFSLGPIRCLFGNIVISFRALTTVENPFSARFPFYSFLSLHTSERRRNGEKRSLVKITKSKAGWKMDEKRISCLSSCSFLSQHVTFGSFGWQNVRYI